MKLTIEQNEALAEILEHQEGLAALFLKFEMVVQDLERQVIQYPLASGSESELVYRKARAEGARKAYNELRALLKIK